MSSLDLDRITHPLRLARGSHKRGSGKGCAMNVISYINGDVEITDYPSCSARPLARLVQNLNDRLADSDGFLSPENAVTVLDLGWQTVGTADTPREVVLAWLADVLVDPEHGVVKYARPDGAAAIRHVAELCTRTANGHAVSDEEWRNAHAAAAAAANAANAAYAAAAYAAYAAHGAYTYVAYTYAAYANAAYAAHAAHAYAAPVAATRALTDFTAWAIRRWRELAGLDAQDIDTEAVDHALAQIAE